MHMYMCVGFTGIAEKNVPQLLTLSLKGHCRHVLHQKGPITLLNTELKIQTNNLSFFFFFSFFLDLILIVYMCYLSVHTSLDVFDLTNL